MDTSIARANNATLATMTPSVTYSLLDLWSEKYDNDRYIKDP